VGSGPAGLTAGIYAARANLAPVVAAGSVQGTLMPGGQLMITTDVENYPGFPDSVEGPELMNRFTEQAKRFGAQIIEEFATEFKLPPGGPFDVKVGDKWYRAESLILANGAAAKWPNLPDEEKYRNNGISACATCDGPLKVFRDKDLFILGGGDSAVEEASFLTRFAKSVSMVVRRDQLRASKIMQQRALSNSKIKILWNHNIVGYKGDTFLRGLVLENTVTKEQKNGSLWRIIYGDWTRTSDEEFSWNRSCPQRSRLHQCPQPRLDQH